jgi:serine/threonine protein kinase
MVKWLRKPDRSVVHRLEPCGFAFLIQSLLASLDAQFDNSSAPASCKDPRPIRVFRNNLQHNLKSLVRSATLIPVDSSFLRGRTIMSSPDPSLSPPGNVIRDADRDAALETSANEMLLRSSFVALVNDLLGGEKTSSFSEKTSDLGFTLGGSAAVATPTQIGGRFSVKKPIGEGGFGTVYLAHDESLDRDVAIKVPHEKLRSDPQLGSQCLKEARLAAKLRHPSIVTIFDISEDEGRIAYIVQEFVQGATLHHLMGQQRLSIRQAIHIVLKVAEAIQFAHARGVYHRDLKPANLIVDENGDIRVLDFGLAVDEETQRASRGQIAGTIAYMSPEQLAGRTHHLDGRTDIWSLGVIFYELLTGRKPFRGSPEEITEQVIRREVAPPRQFLAAIPKRVEACCLKCLAKSVSARYGTALDLIEELKEIIDTETLPEDLPSGPVPGLIPHDTKRLGKDTTKDVPKPGGRKLTFLWWISGGLLIATSIIGLMQVAPLLRRWTNSLVGASKDPRTIPLPPGTSKPFVSNIKSEKELVNSDFTNLFAALDASGEVHRNGGRLTIPGKNPNAVLFADPITFADFDLRLDLTPLNTWSGSIGVLLGMNESATSPGVWLGHQIELSKDEDDGSWYLKLEYIVIEKNEIVFSEQIGQAHPLRRVPGISQVIEVRVRRGQLQSLTIDGVDYGAIAANSTETGPTLPLLEDEHRIRADLIRGNIGILTSSVGIEVNRALISEY